MVKRTVTPDELLDMLKDGATIKKEVLPTEVTWPDLLDVLKLMLAQNREIAEMQARSLADAVEKITTSLQDGRVDTARIERILTAALSSGQRLERPDYAFHVERDSNGQLSGIKATKIVH